MERQNGKQHLFTACFSTKNTKAMPFYKKVKTVDFFTKKRVKNEGQIQQYHIEDDHEKSLTL